MRASNSSRMPKSKVCLQQKSRTLMGMNCSGRKDKLKLVEKWAPTVLLNVLGFLGEVSAFCVGIGIGWVAEIRD